MIYHKRGYENPFSSLDNEEYESYGCVVTLQIDEFKKQLMHEREELPPYFMWRVNKLKL